MAATPRTIRVEVEVDRDQVRQATAAVLIETAADLVPRDVLVELAYRAAHVDTHAHHASAVLADVRLEDGERQDLRS